MAGALLFDLDGTLLQSDLLHVEVFREVFAAHGVPLSQEDYDTHVLGRSNREIFGHFLPAEDWGPLSDEKERRFRARLGTAAEPTRGLGALLDRAEAAGLPCAVVTNAPRENARAMLAAIGMTHRFRAVIAEGDTPRGKPDPAPYRAGLTALGAEASVSVAFEDSRSGTLAAVAAGIFTVGVRSTLSDDDLRRAGAGATVTDFTDPALGPLLARLTGVEA